MKPVIVPSNLMQDNFTGDYDETVRIEIKIIRKMLASFYEMKEKYKDNKNDVLDEINKDIEYNEDQLKRYEE